MDVLISIKPVYVNEIRLGKKKYEFRKRVFKKNVKNIYIYESAPVKKIIGFFPYTGYLSDTPSVLWEECQPYSGIGKSSFFQYFKEKSVGYAIKVDSFQPLDPPLDPKDVFNTFTAPQSYMYIAKGYLKR
ncbi:hypothetical protein IE339_01385 [Priestia koreensis]|nr:hypothetical protein IE339_01385 [Priestia koreensis]